MEVKMNHGTQHRENTSMEYELTIQEALLLHNFKVKVVTLLSAVSGGILLAWLITIIN